MLMERPSSGSETGPRALFVSPHLDDVALSCGGTVVHAARAGEATVVTVFAGGPGGDLSDFARFQHERWGTGPDAVLVRRAEDARAMALLGARYRWLEYPDAIYRGRLYLSDDELFGPLKPDDLPVQEAVIRDLSAICAHGGFSQVYLPLSVGGHVDHRICAAAARPLAAHGVTVFFYEDFPYAARPGTVEHRIEELDLPIEPCIEAIDDVIETRLAAVACYASQLPTIFRHYGDPSSVIRAAAASVRPGGYSERLWQLRWGPSAADPGTALRAN